MQWHLKIATLLTYLPQLSSSIWHLMLGHRWRHVVALRHKARLEWRELKARMKAAHPSLSLSHAQLEEMTAGVKAAARRELIRVVLGTC